MVRKLKAFSNKNALSMEVVKSVLVIITLGKNINLDFDDENGRTIWYGRELYTDISCLGGVFAKNTSRETKYFPRRMAGEI